MGLSGCSLHTSIFSLNVASDESSGSKVLSVKNKSLFAGSSATLNVDSAARTITLTNVPAGRMYSLVLEENGEPLGTVTDLSCSSGNWIENLFGMNVQFGKSSPSTLHIDLSMRTTNGTLQINCLSPAGGNFKVVVNYIGSVYSVLTSSMLLTPGGYRNGSKPSVSADGNVLVWSTTVGLSLKTQIVGKNLTTEEDFLISSVDGTASGIGNGDSSEPMISKDGRYVVFTSASTNLVNGATVSGIYLKDLQDLSVPPVLMSSTDSTQANQASFQGASLSDSPAISGNGRYIFFKSVSTNFSAGTTRIQYYRKDRLNLSSPPVIVSSLDSTQSDQTSYRANRDVHSGAVSEDGRYAIFSSSATNLATGAALIRQIYLKDMQSLASAPILVSSLDSTQSDQSMYEGDGDASFPDVSDDGRYIIFESFAANFASASGYTHIFLKDRLHLDQPPILVSSLDSTQSDQTNYEGNGQSVYAQISGDGRYVTFLTDAENLLSSTDYSGRQTMLKDLQALATAPTVMSSLDSTQSDQTLYLGNTLSYFPTLSGDGRFTFFASAASNFNLNTSGSKIFRKDLQKLNEKPFLINLSDGSGADTGIPFASFGSASGATRITDDGRYGFFLTSSKLGLAENSRAQLYRKDLQNLHIPPIIVSSLDSTQADQTNYASRDSVTTFFVSPDGRYAVFTAIGSNFMTGSNSYTQIFFKDLNNLSAPPVIMSSTDSTQTNQTGLQSSNDCDSPSVSNDGRYVAFSCSASNFATGVAAVQQVYVKDRNNLASAPLLASSRDSTQGNQATYVSNNASSSPQISGNGQKVVFVSNATNLVASGGAGFQIYVKDLTNLSALPVIASSIDSTQANQTSYRGNASSLTPVISADGRYVAFASMATNFYTTVSLTQIYYKDLNSPAVKPLIVSSLDASQSVQTGYASNSNNTSPLITADGRYVFFSSAASVFVTGGAFSQYYRKDMVSGLSSAPKIITSTDPLQSDQTNYRCNTNTVIGGVSSNGSYFSFGTVGNNIVPGATASVTQVYFTKISF